MCIRDRSWTEKCEDYSFEISFCDCLIVARGFGGCSTERRPDYCRTLTAAPCIHLLFNCISTWCRTLRNLGRLSDSHRMKFRKNSFRTFRSNFWPFQYPPKNPYPIYKILILLEVSQTRRSWIMWRSFKDVLAYKFEVTRRRSRTANQGASKMISSPRSVLVHSWRVTKNADRSFPRNIFANH